MQGTYPARRAAESILGAAFGFFGFLAYTQKEGGEITHSSHKAMCSHTLGAESSEEEGVEGVEGVGETAAAEAGAGAADAGLVGAAVAGAVSMGAGLGLLSCTFASDAKIQRTVN